MSPTLSSRSGNRLAFSARKSLRSRGWPAIHRGGRLSPAVFLGLALCLVVSAAMAVSPAQATPVTFVYRPDVAATSVSVAGTFNEWNTGATPMKDTERTGVWSVTLDLAPGRYEYKFVVNGNTWITDETASAFTDDGFGGKNSVLTVGDAPLTVGSAAAEAKVPATAAKKTKEPGVTAVTFRYQPVIGGVQSVSVAGTFNGWDIKANPLSDPDGDGIWEATLNLSPDRYEYKFVVNGDQWFADDHAADSAPDGFGGENSVVQVGNQPLIVGVGGNATAAKPPAAGLHQVTFRYRPSGKPRELALAGTFNDWNVGKTLMTDPDGDGEYTTTLLLPAGDYQYKFVADGNWITDRAHADDYTDDGFGGQNSIVHVDDRFPVIEVEKGDGKISDAGIDYTQNATEVNNMGKGRVEFTFKAHRNDIEGMDLVVSAGDSTYTVPLAIAGYDGVNEYWRTVIAPPARIFRYCPAYHDGATTLYLTPTGFSSTRSADNCFVFDATKFPPFVTPDWVKDGIIYQIFPDRFRNGDPSNDPDFSEWYYRGKNTLPASGKTNGEYYHLVTDWYDIAGLTRSPYRTDGKPDYFSFYGGDIAGVRQGLDYLADLGVTVIYFNPIFQAKSNHKYDCADYRKLDPHFGTNEEFKAFVQEAHAKGIHVVLDIVFNHSGNTHWAFVDAAKKGPKSPYYNWYEFKQWPLPAEFKPGGPKPEDYYACWWGFGDLPDFNFDLSRPNPQENAVRDASKAQVNQPLVKYLLDVVDLWIGELDADGVRLDVPNEVPFWFWKEFNRKVKSVKPDAYIVGEIWGNASDWVSPTLFDATMNYAYFRDPVTKFLGQGRGTAQEFDRTLATGRNAYPTQAVEVMMNLLDSHDTVRFRQQVGGDVNRVKLAYAFGMTYVGAPHIYYGDEIAMMGGKDPDCRRPFRWNWKEDPQRVALHDYVRTLAHVRANHPALRRGDFRTVLAEGLQYAYLRSLGDDRVLVVLNAAAHSGRLELDWAALGNPTGATDLVTGKPVPVGKALTLPPESAMVLQLD